MQHSMKLISVGRHTRLGDVLEHAVEGVSFETVRSEDFALANRKNQRLLFAVSSDAFSENEALSALTCDLLSGKCSLEGSVCAVIGDGEQGGALHADILKLLLALGCMLPNRPCLEASRDLKNVSVQDEGKGAPPFELYRRQARALVERLLAFTPAKNPEKRIRFVPTTEDEGAGHDWRSAIGREAAALGAELASDTVPTETTLLLCENKRNIPDEETIRRIDGLDKCALSCIVASPRFGADFYCMQILERACIQGVCSLAPHAFTVCEGVSAAEALAIGELLEKAKRAIAGLTACYA
jgi:hypothetical protein